MMSFIFYFSFDAVRPVVGALSLFRRGLLCYCRASFLSFVVSSGPCRMSSEPRLFIFFVRASFACCQGLLVSLISHVCALLRSRFSAALAVLGLPLGIARLGSVRYLRRHHPHWRPTCLVSQGSWAPIGRSTGRSSRSVHSCNPTWEMLLRARVDIL